MPSYVSLTAKNTDLTEIKITKRDMNTNVTRTAKNKIFGEKYKRVMKGVLYEFCRCCKE